MDDNPSSTEKQLSKSQQITSSEMAAAASDYQNNYAKEKTAHRRRQFIGMVGGMKAYETFTFEKFLESWKQNEAFQAAVKFDPDRENLFLWGPTRVGKTHLANAIARKFHDLGDTVQIISIPDFKDRLRLFESEHRYTEKIKFITDLVEARILILHELGRGKITELVQETLWSILERRITAGRNGFIGTSNFSPMNIGTTHGGTISARLNELCGRQGTIKFNERSL